MIKKNILNIVLLSSSILASDDLASIKTERSDKIDFNFSFGLNKPDEENIDIQITQPEDSNLYEGLAHNWKNISNTFGHIYNSDIVPFVVQLQELATKLGDDPEFQRLLWNNLGKIKDSLSVLYSDVSQKFASSKDLQEISNGFQELNKNADEKMDPLRARAFAINIAEKVVESKDLQEFIKNRLEKFTLSASPLITEIADKASNIAGYKE